MSVSFRISALLILFAFNLSAFSQNASQQPGDSKSLRPESVQYKISESFSTDILGFSIPDEIDLYCDFAGNLFLALSNRNMILKISPEGKILAQIGGFGFGPKQFNTPRWLGSPDGGLNIYVLDRENRRVVRLNNSLEWIDQFDIGSSPGGKSSGILTGFGINSLREKFVSDPQNSRIIHYDREGRYLGDITGQKTFLDPGPISVDDRDYLNVLSRDGKSIYVFDNLGNLEKRFIPASGDSIIALKAGKDYVYYIDATSNKIVISDKNLRVKMDTILPGLKDTKLPSYIAIAPSVSSSRIWVVDKNNNRISAYDPVKK
jgi:DNA-binding beta-propeller fold protein YncE